MRRSGICSSGARAGAAGLIAMAAFASRCEAKVFLTQEEALKLAFPGVAEPERRTAYLTEEQAARVQKESGQNLPSRVISWYRSGGVTAWFDTHVVRTMAETIMIVVNKDGSIARIDILSFSEPEEYLPRARWMEQIHGRKLDDDLSLRGAIRPMTGATLTARAIVGASRRTLALHRLLEAEEAAP